MKRDLDNECKVFLMISDEKGHSNREISEKLVVDTGNQNKKLHRLKKEHIIEQGSQRKTSSGKSHPNQPEITWYIVQDINAFAYVLETIGQNGKFSYVISFLKSKYARKILNKYDFVTLCQSLVERKAVIYAILWLKARLDYLIEKEKIAPEEIKKVSEIFEQAYIISYEQEFIKKVSGSHFPNFNFN